MSKQETANLVAVVNSLTDEELREILEMERELFPESLQDFSYEKEIPKGKTAVVAYGPEGKVAGYIFAVPHHEAHSQLKDIDSNMPEASDAHYIESIAIRSDLQGKGYFGKLMRKFKEATEGRTITMHARVCNNCSAAMQKHGAVHSHTVPNWFDSGEEFDYLTIDNK
ncbi:MAG: GNAT family N-acetyltransferase [Candidatus Parcubacteria bacterium]|nr:GNAT family N-acetyltransferase [Candidatus Parcubacteria bacterium]